MERIHLIWQMHKNCVHFAMNHKLSSIGFRVQGIDDFLVRFVDFAHIVNWHLVQHNDFLRPDTKQGKRSTHLRAMNLNGHVQQHVSHKVQIYTPNEPLTKCLNRDTLNMY